MLTLRFPSVLAALGLLLAAPAGAETYTVTETADAGAGTLRQAITDANGHGGPDRIVFAIPEAACNAEGVCRIALESALPPLTEAVEIDGTTQPRHGTAPENACAEEEAPSYMRIELIGQPTVNALEPILTFSSAGASTLRGLAIGGAGSPISITSPGPHRIQCNHLGASGPGGALLGAGFAAIVIQGAGAGAIVGTDGDGSDDLAEANVIATSSYGIYVNGNDDNRIAGNSFGLAADRATPLACQTGVLVRQDSERNRVGSDEDGVSDELESNVFEGCSIGFVLPNDTQGSDNQVVRNRFGEIAPNTVALELRGGGQTVVRNNVVGGNGTGIKVVNAVTLSPLSVGNCIAGNTTGLRHEGTEAVALEQSWWGAADGPGGAGPGSGDPITITAGGAVDVDPFQTAGCVFVPEAPASAAGFASAAVLGILARRRRCAASSSA